MSFLALFSRFILRAQRREKVRSLIAVLGITLGVAVMTAVRLANVSVTDTFRAAVTSVSGQASLRVRGTAGRFDEQRLGDLAWLQEYGVVSPVIETYAMVATAPDALAQQEGLSRGELLHVLGVDVLLDFPLRDYHVLQMSRDGERNTAREVLSLLDDPRAVILTERFLRREGLRVGDEISLVFGTRQRQMTIRGVLSNRGPARTLDGNFALMDIAAAQQAADRLGTVDYADILLSEGSTVDETLVEIRSRLPQGLIVELPEAQSGRADTMISAFQFNLTALSAVSLIVGLFLIYNTVSISVAARRDEIGMLQALGAGRRTVLQLFLLEAALLAAVGLVLGLPLGRFLASAAVQATAQTVETFYIAAVADSSAASLGLGLPDVLFSILLTLPLAMLAAAIPAWEAASIQPVDAIRGRSPKTHRLRARRYLLIGAVFLLAGWLLTRGQPIGGIPILGFLAELSFLIAGSFCVPAVLYGACALARHLPSRFLPRAQTVWHLAAANLTGAWSRVSVSVAALAVSLSMMVAIDVMVGSFRETVVYWLDSVLSADLAVRPVMQTSSLLESRLSPELVEAIRQDPDVRETIWFSSRQVPWGTRNVRLAVTELDKALEHGRLVFKVSPQGPRPAEGVFLSESFALRFDKKVGDRVSLPTSSGDVELPVCGVYYDYASNQGTVLIDAPAYQRYYADHDPNQAPQNLSIYLHPDADVEAVRRRVLARAGETEQIYCVTYAEVRREALRIFDSTFTITYALQLIAVVIAGLGVASTLITLIYHRQREIGLLSLIGATPGQIRRVIVSEAVIVGGVSQLMGIVIGILLALVLIYVINVQSFGWTIQFHLPIGFLLQSTLLVVGGSALFALYPAVQAANVRALQTVREE